MHFASTDIVEAPAVFAFRQMSDFAYFERLVASSGAGMTRIDTMTEVGIGVLWEVRFALRGRRRKIDLKLSDYIEPKLMQFTGMSDGLLFVFRSELEHVDAERCRLTTRLDVKPRTLAGRMMLQSARLTKPTLNRRYARRVRDYAARVSTLYAEREGDG